MKYFESKLKNKGYKFIIGVDEAGRGPLAGPVVAAAVSLKNNKFTNKIKDSKKISKIKREKAFNEIFERAHVGIGIISESVIDEANIINATYYAMTNAVTQLISNFPNSYTKKRNFSKNVLLLIDGNRFKSDLPYEYKTIVKGDDLVLSISCASIIAKVTRDRIMENYHRIYPEYGFKKHKGYPTKNHKKALKKYGPSEIHRTSFKY